MRWMEYVYGSLKIGSSSQEIEYHLLSLSESGVRYESGNIGVGDVDARIVARLLPLYSTKYLLPPSADNPAWPSAFPEERIVKGPSLPIQVLLVLSVWF